MKRALRTPGAARAKNDGSARSRGLAGSAKALLGEPGGTVVDAGQ